MCEVFGFKATEASSHLSRLVDVEAGEDVADGFLGLGGLVSGPIEVEPQQVPDVPLAVSAEACLSSGGGEQRGVSGSKTGEKRRFKGRRDPSIARTARTHASMKVPGMRVMQVSTIRAMPPA